MNLSILQQELLSSIDQWHSKVDIEERLSQLDDNLKALDNRHKKLEKLVAREKRDFDKVEGKSIGSVFQNLWGNKEEKRTREEEQYLEAVLKYNQCVQDIELVQYEREILLNKLKNLKDIKEKIEVLYDKAEYALLQSDSPSRLELLDIRKKEEAQNRRDLHIQEILDIANNSAKCVNNIIHHLKKAQNWGHLSQYENSRKAQRQMYRHIDKAQEWLYPTKRNLQLLDQEMEQLFRKSIPDIYAELPNFNSFTDVFFKNIISDWIIKNKLHSALQQMLVTQSQLASYQKSLKHYLLQSRESLQALEKKKKTLIREAKV